MVCLALSLPRSDLFLARDMISYEELWRAMKSLTHVQRVEVGYKCALASGMTKPEKQIPGELFQSATSVRLLGCMQ